MISIFNIIKVYSLYFRKQVLRTGILDNKIFRIYILFISGGLYITVFYILSLFFDVTGDKIINYILHVYTTTVVTWALLIFICVRFIFMLSKDFQNVVQYFPVTKKEQIIASRVFELFFGLGIIIMFFSAFFLSMISRHPTYFDEILITTIITGFIAYITASIIYYVLFILISNVKYIKAWSEYIALIVLVLFSFNLAQNTQSTVLQITEQYFAQGIQSNIFNIWLSIYEKGYLLGIIAVTLSLCIFLWLLIICSPAYDLNIKIKKFKFIKLHSTTLLDVYILSFLRNKKFLTNVIFATTLFILSIFFKLDPSVAVGSFLVLTLQGLSHFEDTNEIRELVLRCSWKYNPIKDYIALCTSQMTVVLSVMILPLLIALGIGISDKETLVSLSMLPFVVIFVTIATVTLGIMFPAKSNNPFSPFISLSVTFVISLFVLLVCVVFQLTDRDTMMLLSLLLTVIIIIGIVGLNNYFGGLINEKNI